MTTNSYEFVLALRTRGPLSHGAGVHGNEQTFMRRSYLLASPSGDQVQTVEVPCVSGAALKATLREHATVDWLERAGVPRESVSRSRMRLLLKGGQLGGGGQSVRLEELRELLERVPLLQVFGLMDGNSPVPAALSCSDVRPWALELAKNAVLTEAEVEAHEGPMPSIYQLTGVVTHYAHDVRDSRAGRRYLEGPTRKALEDLAAANADAKSKGKAVPKEQRREAKESMPHSAEVLKGNAPLVATVRLEAVDAAAFGAFGMAVARWRRGGAVLGGQRTKGMGSCDLRFSHGVRFHTGGPVPVSAEPESTGTEVSEADPTAQDMASAYDERVREHADWIREWVREDA